MREVDALKRAVIAEVDQLADRLWAVADSIGRNSEVGHQEHQAVATLTGLLASGGVDPETNVYGLPTAFEARIGPNRRPRVALLARYDALPRIGHGRGHNLIGVAAVGAGLALASVMDYLPGSVVVLGTPAEESTVDDAGAMAHLVRAGAFDAVDARITFRPGHSTHIRSSDPPNEAIARAFRRNLEAIGLDVLGLDVLDARPEASRSLADFDSVARRVPCVEAAIAIAEPGVPLDSAAFAEAALSDRAHGALLAAAKGLAMTAIDLLADPSLLSAAKADFDAGPDAIAT